MGKTGKYVLIGVGGLFVWWFVDRNIISLGFPISESSAGALFGPIANGNRAVACAMGLQIQDAGRVRKAPAHLRSLFGAQGAGAVLAAATQTMAQYDAPPQNPPIGKENIVTARTGFDPTKDPANPQSPNPQPPRQTEPEGDRGKLSTPVLVGGFLVLLVALYFIAK